MPDNTISNKRIAKNTAFMSLRMVIVLAVNLFTTRIVLQALGVVDYGVYNVVCGFVTMFAFLTTSMSNGIQRFFNYEYGKNGIEGANRVYCTALYIQAFLAIVIVVIVEFIGLWYLQNKMVIPFDRTFAANWIFQFSLLTLVFGIMQAPFTAAVIAHEKMDFYAIVSVLDAILKLGVAYLTRFLWGDKLIIYGMLMTVVASLTISTYFWYCKHFFVEISFKPRIENTFLKKMLSFSGWNLFGTFANVMENQGIDLVLNFFFGPIVNAARGVANQINGGIHSFVANITVPVRPQIIQSYARGNVERTLDLTYSVSKICGLIILLLAIPISLEINFILQLWLGSDIPEHTSSFTILIIITSLFNTLQSSLSAIVHATGKMKKYQVSCTCLRLLSIPMAFVLIKKYGTPEIALSVVCIQTSVVLFVSCLIVKELVDFSLRKYLFQVIVPIIIVIFVSVILLFPVCLIMKESLLRLIVIIVLSIMIIGFLSYLIAFNNKERKMVLQMTKTLNNKIFKK